MIGQDAFTVANPRPHPNAGGRTVYDTCRRRITRDSWSFQEFRDHPQLGGPRRRSPRPATPAAMTPGSAPWLSLLALLPAAAQRFVLHSFTGVSRDNLIAVVHSVRHVRLGRADLTMLLWVWDRRAAVFVSAQVSGPVDYQAAWAAESVVCRHVQRPPTWRL